MFEAAVDPVGDGLGVGEANVDAIAGGHEVQRSFVLRPSKDERGGALPQALRLRCTGSG